MLIPAGADQIELAGGRDRVTVIPQPYAGQTRD